MNDAQLRIGDADRETAARELGEHYALGRITTEEHSERLEQIWAARTRADLAPAFSDLPGSGSPRARSASSSPAPWGSPAQSRGTRPRVPAMPFLLKVLIAVIVIALVLSHLSLLVVALVLYVIGVRRLAHRHHRYRWR